MSEPVEYALESDGQSGYQPRGQSWDPERPDILDLLGEAEQVQVYPIYRGSNHTFLALLDAGDAGRSMSVYKPARGEYPLYDFPAGTLYKREIGAWLVDRILGWGIVPPTIETNGQYGLGSLQIFIESPDEAEIEIADLRRMAVLDAILNNADRKADHCLPSLDGRLWGIDHGLTFHSQPKLRTVLWHFAGLQLFDDELVDLQRARDILCERRRWEAVQLNDLISGGEWRALVFRIERLIESRRLPNPRYKPVPYRW